MYIVAISSGQCRIEYKYFLGSEHLQFTFLLQFLLQHIVACSGVEALDVIEGEQVGTSLISEYPEKAKPVPEPSNNNNRSREKKST